MTDGQPATSDTKPNTEYNNKESDKPNSKYRQCAKPKLIPNQNKTQVIVNYHIGK